MVQPGLEIWKQHIGDQKMLRKTNWLRFKPMIDLAYLIDSCFKKKVPLLTGMDIMAPCLMIGLAFGRIGCYLNGCCYGEECQLPWAAAFPLPGHRPATRG